MDLLGHHRRMLAWTAWANRESHASVARCGAPPPRAVRWLAHIAGAERTWLARLRGEPAPLAVWPDLALDACRRELDASAEAWAAFAAALDAGRLEAPVTYRNSRGEEFSSTPHDILAHATSHSACHRGQIAAELRAAGHEPVLTDYIHAVRQGFVR
jgi:uncharacterized damage-inducible protein DinB